jgi:hypothetical protein
VQVGSVPEQAPFHPMKLYPAAAVAVSVTEGTFLIGYSNTHVPGPVHVLCPLRSAGLASTLPPIDTVTVRQRKSEQFCIGTAPLLRCGEGWAPAVAMNHAPAARPATSTRTGTRIHQALPGLRRSLSSPLSSKRLMPSAEV